LEDLLEITMHALHSGFAYVFAQLAHFVVVYLGKMSHEGFPAHENKV
jgi:hypothetical protein